MKHLAATRQHKEFCGKFEDTRTSREIKLQIEGKSSIKIQVKKIGKINSNEEKREQIVGIKKIQIIYGKFEVFLEKSEKFSRERYRNLRKICNENVTMIDSKIFLKCFQKNFVIILTLNKTFSKIFLCLRIFIRTPLRISLKNFVKFP